ncbi:hypothetical protein ACTFIU_005709 [Dictyostelium citrinum]
MYYHHYKECGDSGFIKIKNHINVARNAITISPILKLRCENHNDQVTHITSGKDFANVPQGGCLLNTSTRLECGHETNKQTSNNNTFEQMTTAITITNKALLLAISTA